MRLFRKPSENARSKPLAAVAVVASVSMVAAACGSTASSASNSTGTTAATGTTASPSTTAVTSETLDASLSALVPASFKAKSSITLAANATYPPDEYFASNNTTIIGFDPDLASAVGQILGLKFNFVNTAFADIIPGLQAGHFDLGWSSATATPARQQVVNFVTYIQSGVGFIVPSSSTLTINSLSDLCGLKVAVEAGSLEDDTATAQSQQCTASGKKAIAIQRYQNENQNLLALTSGRAQVSTAGSQIIPYLVKQSNGALKSVGTPYDMSPLGIEFPKSAPASLLKAFQGAINKMIADGTYARIMTKWGEQANMITHSEILPAGAAG